VARTLIAVPSAGTRRSVIDLMSQLGTLCKDPALECEALVLINQINEPTELAGCALAAEIETQLVPERGLAAVRNAALVAAESFTYLAFLDDDEQPHNDWLATLVRTADETQADVVMGSVVAELPVGGSPWVSLPEFFRPEIDQPSGAFEGEVYTANVLIRTSFITSQNLRFDADFGTSGAEDTDFFRRARACGAQIVWQPEARVVESIDPDRVSLPWLLRRNAAESANYWRLEGLPEAKRGRPQLLARRAGRAARGITRCAGGLLTLNRHRITFGLCDLAVVGGTLAAMVGWRPWPKGYGKVRRMQGKARQNDYEERS